MVQLLDLFSDWSEDTNSQDLIRKKKRELFMSTDYRVPILPGKTPDSARYTITIQKGKICID